MAGRNIWATRRPSLFNDNYNKPPRDKGKSRQNRDIVLMNVAILGAYTIIAMLNNEETPIVNAVILAGHALLSIILAGIMRSWAWAVTGVIILLVAFFTYA